MSNPSLHRKIDWTAEDRARHRAIREKFQRERPTQEELLATGDYVRPWPQGVVLDLLQALADLRRAREAAGLSVAAVAERAGLEEAAIQKLENGFPPDLTLDTLCRYAAALGKELRWVVQDSPAATP
jgi:hypothetical protein